MLIVTEQLNIAVNDFEAKKSVRHNRMLIATELFSSRTQLNISEGRILLRESSQGESSGLRVTLEGLLKTHYDVYSFLADAYSLLSDAYSLLANAYSLH